MKTVENIQTNFMLRIAETIFFRFKFVFNERLYSVCFFPRLFYSSTYQFHSFVLISFCFTDIFVPIVSDLFYSFFGFVCLFIVQNLFSDRCSAIREIDLFTFFFLLKKYKYFDLIFQRYYVHFVLKTFIML